MNESVALVAAAVLAHTSGWATGVPVIVVVMTAVGYVLAVRAVHRRRGKALPLRPEERRRAAAMAGGLSAVLLALAGPVESFADDLFWIHMVQHLLLLAVAAPLLALAAPWIMVARLAPSTARRHAVALWRATRSDRSVRASLVVVATPAAAWTLFNANLVAWHVPSAFDLTLRSSVAHDLEHLMFIGFGIMFWRHAIGAPPRRVRLGAVQRALYVTAASLVAWVVGIALTIAAQPLYAYHAWPGGPSPLADQRIAAGVMIVPGSIPFVAATIVALSEWLRQEGDAQPAVARRRTRLRAGVSGRDS